MSSHSVGKHNKIKIIPQVSSRWFYQLPHGAGLAISEYSHSLRRISAGFTRIIRNGNAGISAAIVTMSMNNTQLMKG